MKTTKSLPPNPKCPTVNCNKCGHLVELTKTGQEAYAQVSEVWCWGCIFAYEMTGEDEEPLVGE